MAIAVAQVGGATGTGGSNTASFGSTTTTGSLIAIVGFGWSMSAASATKDSDSKSNTYTLAKGNVPGGASGIEIAYNNAGTRGASHTCTFVDGTASVATGIIEITGQDSSTPFDSTTAATATDNKSTFDVTAAAAISGNQAAVYGVMTDAASATAWTPPTGYTDLYNDPHGDTNWAFESAYKVLETGTPTVGAARSVVTPTAAEVFVTFKEASSGTALDVPLLTPIPQYNIHRM